LEFAKEFGGRDIWSIVPQYFLDNQKEFSEESNHIVAFLASDRLEFGKDLFCPLSVFAQHFRTFCIERGVPRQQLDFKIESLQAALADLTTEDNPLEFRKGRLQMRYNDTTKCDQWIYGLDVKLEEHQLRL
jgi:hypothetical protein